MEILTGEQMRNVDRRAIEGMGIPSLELMEAAGRGVAEALSDDCPDLRSRRVVVLCGRGNNGGDGLVIARHLFGRKVDVGALLLATADALRGDAAANLRAAREAGVPIVEAPDPAAWSEARRLLDGSPLVIDAMLGTGVVGGARGLIREVIEELGRRSPEVVSVDLPSGIDADRPTVEGSAVRARRTYTLCRPKLALAFEPAATFAGDWKVVPIGIPDQAVRAEEPPLEWLDAAAASLLLPARRADSHKGTYGHLLAVAGGRGKAGAAVLVARGALRSGVGLVTVATAGSVRGEVAIQQAEVMTEPLPETEDGRLSELAGVPALELLSTRTALALGPGLGLAPGTRAAVASITAGRSCPAVLDADALNALAGEGLPAGPEAGDHPLVLTPHPGEAARLLGRTAREVQADRLGSVQRLARASGAVVVLKGHRTLVGHPDGRVAVNASGNPGMATAGSGDVLTGMVGAWLARGLPAYDAARLAVFVHGHAGDRAAARLGQDGLIAGDLLDELPGALHRLSLRGA